MPTERVPWKLQVVAYLWLLSGILAAIKIFMAACHHRFALPLEVLGIPIFFGLLHYRSGWRTLAFIFTGLGLVLMPIGFGIMFFDVPFITSFEFFGTHSIVTSRVIITIIGCLSYALVVWQYRVLTDPEIKRLFQ